jgi:hypothetical protein
MSRAFLGAVSRFLSILVYMPTPPGWLNRLSHLRGTYRRSTSESVFVVFIGVMTICAAALSSVLLLQELRNRRDPAMIGILACAIPLMGTLGVVSYRRLRLHYKFDGGTLLALSGSERTLWSEPLAGLMSISCTYPIYGTMSMFLIWHHRKRRVEVFGSLYAALNADT